MSVRAKFIVYDTMPTNDGVSIVLNPVVDGSDENKKFYAATPGGQILLTTINTKASKQFEKGKSFYVDFTEAPA